MARRKRKNRTHLKGEQTEPTGDAGVPKSFIVKHGPVGSSLTQLVRDIRKVMEPNTASRLKVRSFSFVYTYMNELTPVGRNVTVINSKII